MREKARYRSAVSLDYCEGQDAAPLLSAKGDSHFADIIVSTARRFGIPVVERPELARTLGAIDVDQEIPVELYRAVAILFKELKTSLQRGRQSSPIVPPRSGAVP